MKDIPTLVRQPSEQRRIAIGLQANSCLYAIRMAIRQRTDSYRTADGQPSASKGDGSDLASPPCFCHVKNVIFTRGKRISEGTFLHIYAKQEEEAYGINIQECFSDAAAQHSKMSVKTGYSEQQSKQNLPYHQKRLFSSLYSNPEAARVDRRTSLSISISSHRASSEGYWSRSFMLMKL